MRMLLMQNAFPPSAAAILWRPPTVAMAATLPPMTTPTYFALAERPGVEYFRCTRLLATLSTDGCAGMWREANEGRSERRALCERCPIGARHAGISDASLAPIRGKLICARCERPATRLIGAHVCVSCKNREYELLRGYNAKGAFPVKLAPLAPRRIKFLAGSQVVTLRREHTTSVRELIVAALRDATHTVRFAFAGAAPAARQLRLF